MAAFHAWSRVGVERAGRTGDGANELNHAGHRTTDTVGGASVATCPVVTNKPPTMSILS